MNTPAHALLNLLALSDRHRAHVIAPVTAGSLLPDAPMLAFYGWQRLLGTPERTIWRERYFEPAWQAFFDLFNSLPLIAAAWLAGHLAGWRWLPWMAAGMALHVGLDLPLHHDDAHRHFWPLSDWRFHSPVSYWDPAHFGRQMALTEMGACGFAAAWLWHRHPEVRTRMLVTTVAATYAAYWGFVFMVWA